MSESGCSKFCHSMSTVQLHFLNIIDFFLGCALIAFAAYLANTLGLDKFQNPQSSWVGWSCGILGGLLLLIALLCFSAMTMTCCRWGMTPARVLSVIVVVFDLALGITCLAKKQLFFDYISDSEGNGITHDDVELLKKWFSFFMYAVFVMAGLQIYKIFLSRGFREKALRIDGEFERLLHQEDKAHKERIETREKERQEKYNDLRQYYRNKYNRDTSAQNNV